MTKGKKVKKTTRVKPGQRVNPAKRADHDKRKKAAVERLSKILKGIEDADKRKAAKEAKKADLERRLQDQPEAEQEATRKELQALDQEMIDIDAEIASAKEDELKARKEQEDTAMEDVSEVDEPDSPKQTEGSDPGGSSEKNKNKKNKSTKDDDGESDEDSDNDDDDDPDNPKPSTESMNPVEFAAKLMKGLSISKRTEAIDLTRDIQLRNTQAVTCYKSGFGKPVIVVDCEIPDALIYRIRKDIMAPDGTPNLMRWRRGGEYKDVKNEIKWSSRDIKDILGIAIDVPLGYNGKPEDLARVIPGLSKAEKKKLKRKGKPLPKEPKQPEVQLLIEWWKAIPAKGETEGRVTSWESRTTCRQIWKKKGVADDFLLDVAIKKETAYRKLGGRHSTEERSLSPIRIPRGTPEVDDDVYSDESGTEDEEEEEEQKKKKQKKKEQKKGRKKGKNEEEDEEEEDEEEEDEEEEEKQKKKQKKEQKKKERKKGKNEEEDEEEEDEEEEDEEEEEKQKKKKQKKKEENKKKEKKKEKKEEKKEEKKKEEEKTTFDASDYKAALDKFALRFRALKRIDLGAELTPTQEGDLIQAFEYVWAKRQAEK